MKLLIATASLMLLQVTCPPLPAPAPTPTPAPTQAPTPSPTATPSALPTPSPSATASATPEPTPDLRCNLWPSAGRCEDRPGDASQFEGAVREAQDGAAAAGFVQDGKVANGYLGEVVRRLRAKGYCAIDGRQGGHTSPDEVWVKKDKNSRSEHFDVVVSDGSPWTHYAARCIPAAF